MNRHIFIFLMLAAAGLAIPQTAYYGMDYHSSFLKPNYQAHMVPVVHSMPYDTMYRVKTLYNYPLHY